MKKISLILILFFVGMTMAVPVIINWPGNTKQDEGPVNSQQIEVKVADLTAKRVVAMPLEQYLVGVVAAEMPAEFEEAALQAQVIAARTYTVKRKTLFKGDMHPEYEGAEVCTDPTHCQAWLPEKALKTRWGIIKYPLYIHKIKKAVEATSGKVIVYGNQLADPVYHGSCGGVGTEDSENVWKYSVPYLRGVECSWDDMDNPKLTASHEYALETVSQKLEVGADSLATLLKGGRYSNKQRLISVKNGDELIPASVLRNKLGLASTVFSWKVSSDKITITTRGKGHGVGMCQYGANGMAKAGKSYEDIIHHYYRGTKLVDVNNLIAP